jgi:hypothetical protein
VPNAKEFEMAEVIALITKDSKLEARTHYVDGGTEIDIHVNGVPVAFKKIGGRWNSIQALKEFKKNQKGWKDEGHLELVKQLGLLK